MATLSVWKFDTATGADDAGRTLRALHDGALVTLHDAAVVSWDIDDRKPKTRSLDESLGALGGAFWGFLVGLIFFVPLLGTAIGLAAGALSASLRDVGIDDAFIEQVRASVTPGTSALFVLSSDAVTDEVRKAFAGTEMELIQTNLSEEDERALREAFAN
ncbi:DUF1269 domain-containing protein [Conyzicola sp.]|uniref:DUF1269 domain-containing protein n=1 Tax=Conyzicola sp. TaxID=1969404 RepID=UPI00398906FF